MTVTLRMLTWQQFEKQVRFAAAGALTDGAFAAREALKRSMSDAFTLRGRHAEKGLRVTKASRRNPEAQAGQLREYLEDQVVGGTRPDAAIPFARLRRGGRKIRRTKWPGAQISQGRAFVTRPKRGGGRAIVRRVGKRRLRYQWSLPAGAQRVRPRWEYGEIAARAGIPAIERAFPTRFARALATARVM
jgi:hypothetical protein